MISKKPAGQSMGEGLPNSESDRPQSPNLRRPGALPIVYDESIPCPYLPNQTARMPLRYAGPFDVKETDVLLASGFRRSGPFVYDTQCEGCAECIPTRLDVGQFQLSKSQKRVWKRGQADVESRWLLPTVDQQRTSLFNLHRQDRDLSVDGTEATADDYRSFLVDTCMRTTELSFWIDGKLAGISIMDIGKTSVSAVYTFFGNAARRYSLGTYAVLMQVDWAKKNDRQYVYLGFNVAENQHLNYKSRFRPQQRRINNVWQTTT